MPKNKLLYLFFFTFCACKPIIIYRLPPEYVIIIDRRATGYDISVDHFVRDYYFNSNGKFLRVNDTIVPSDYHIYKWFYIDNKRIELEYIKIINGYLEGIYTINPDMPLKEIYYKKSKMAGKYIVYNTDRQILYRTYFTNGNGYWKDYYYKEGKIREEGKVVNHYKYGEWKYYNENGKIDSIKAYQLSDSIDVRFPHCLFNKNDPCY